MTGKTDIMKLWKQVREHPNVVGYCPVLTNPIRKNKPRRGWCFRVYVAPKLPLEELDKNDILPSTLDSIRVDVVDFTDYFREEITLNGEFILIDDAYIGESLFLSP